MKNTKHTKGEWRQFPKHKEATYLEKDNNYRSIVSGNGYFDRKTNSGFDLTGYISEEDAELISSSPKLLKRVTDLEIGISNFLTHLEENRGNYETEELNKLKALVAQERPYFPTVSYHDNWTGKEVATEND